MKKQLLSIAAISLLTMSVQASDVPYSYLDVEYNSLDDADGFTLGGSFDFNNGFYGFGEYSLLTVDAEDAFDVETDFDRLKLGAGYNHEISPNTDLIAELSFVNYDISAGGISDDDNGYALGVGLRSMITDNIELNAKAEYLDIFNESDTGFEVGGLYYLDNGFAFGAGYETDGDDLDGFSLKLRYKF